MALAVHRSSFLKAQAKTSALTRRLPGHNQGSFSGACFLESRSRADLSEALPIVWVTGSALLAGECFQRCGEAFTVEHTHAEALWMRFYSRTAAAAV